MRVPKINHYSDADKIQYVHYDKPAPISRFPSITNDKQREKIIKSIERKVRRSLEYKDFIKFLREFMDMTNCEFFHNIDSKRKKGLIQIHHEPFDLYSIVDIVMKRHEEEIGYINPMMIAGEVMKLHYLGLVGLIPLSITPHELVHDGELAVPLNCVYGRFVEFTRLYYDAIVKANPAYITMLDEKIALTKKLDKADMSILSVRYIYTVIDGFELPKVINKEDIKVSDNGVA